jgi:hypothetical protein
MEVMYYLARNGEQLAGSFVNIQPGTLTGEVSPEVQNGRFEVFRTAISGLVGLEDEVHQRENEIVSLGPVSTHVASGTKVEVDAQPGFVYDLFHTQPDENGVVRVAGGGRYAVTDAGEYTAGQMVTLDEARFLGALGLGLGEEQAEKVSARIVPMTAWGAAGRLAIVGFELIESAVDASGRAGVMVDHLGGVEFYHGRNVAQTREVAGIR